ncbi:FGGY-family carbohydrate kinase [Alphaproteobacteria bacterium]|nr:FGGY-family carbohydrate kinase [Alphaproteobacteria bacterium]
MEEKLYLGIDIGTYETKGVLVNISGKIIANAFKKHELIIPKSGWAEHRPKEDWWDDFIYICKSLLLESQVNPKNIKTVSVSAIGPCMLPVNKNGIPLMNAILYGVDTRAYKEIEYLNKKIGKDKIINFCGNALTSQSVGPKILWLKNNKPEIFKSTYKFLNSTSYINFKLTGDYAIDHFSAANSSPFYDIKKCEWSDFLIKDILDLNQLPRLFWSNEIIGNITSKAAKETGLSENTVVSAGTIDAAAEALSVGVNKPGDMMMMYGSTKFFITITDYPIFDERLWYAPWLFKNESTSLAGLSTSGTLTHWFKNELAKDLNGDDIFIKLAKEAETSPVGSKGIIFLPYFSGERSPIHDTHAKGSFFGLNLTHTRADLYRSIFEGIAYGTKHVFDTFEELNNLPKKLYSVGGGTKNKLWSQTTSDIIGVNQIIRQKTIGASYGDAFLGALSIGDVQRKKINEWNKIDFEIKAKKNNIYDKGYKYFRKLYENTKDLMREMDE